MTTHTIGTKMSVSVIDSTFMKALGRSIRRKGMSVRAVSATYHLVLRTGCGLKLFTGPCGCYSLGHPTHSVFAPRRHTMTHHVTKRDFILLGGRPSASETKSGPSKDAIRPMLPLGVRNGVTMVNPLTSAHAGVPKA